MSSMYKYPTVPRLDPKEIPTPKCMYVVQPIFNSAIETFNGLVMDGDSNAGNRGEDNSDLQVILEKQESVIKKLSELETRISSSGISDIDLIEIQMKTMLLKQDGLLKSIDLLEQRLRNAAISDLLKLAATSCTGDISIFVNWSSMPSRLKSYIKFFKTQGLKFLIQIHQHSSVTHLKLSDVWTDIHDKEPLLNRVDYDGTITFIIREQCTLEPILIVDPLDRLATIEGDDGIMKFLDQRFGHLLRKNKH